MSSMRLAKRRLTLFQILSCLVFANLLLSLLPNFPPPLHRLSPLEQQLDTSLQALSDPFNAARIRDSHNPESRVVFYNVYLNPTTGVTYLKSHKIVDEQLQVLPNNTRVYYNIIGQKPTRGICANYLHLNCTQLGYYEQGGEDLTLQQLWTYCREHPRERVTYLHDKGSFRQSSSNIRNRRRATQGAVSEECLRMPLSDNYPCQICGLKFQYMPHLSYSANMWTAECSFIRQLVPPETYIERRTELLQSLYQQYECLSQPADSRMKATSTVWNLSDTLFLRNLGLGRYALERWMTNHPSVLPCEVWAGALNQLWDMSKLKLAEPTEFGKMVSKKVKARQSWFLQQEYAAFYPNVTVHPILAKDQSKPKPRPCW